MSSRLGILVIHGMGRQRADFAEAMIAEVTRRVDRAGGDGGAIRWEPVSWAPALERREVELWRDLNRHDRLGWRELRRFVVGVLGDAVAYQHRPGQPHTVYDRVHGIIHESVRRLEAKLGAPESGEPAPLMIVAHSLGATMMSNYVWDRQHAGARDPLGRTPFERMESLAAIVTFGCNLPLFTLAIDPVVAIEFPPPSLPDHLHRKAAWLNFYDPDDILAYPLKPLSPSYDRAVTADVPVNVGGMLASWNALSHSAYWTDNDFTRRVAELIREFV